MHGHAPSVTDASKPNNYIQINRLQYFLSYFRLLLTVAHLQFMIMLAELQKGLGLKKKKKCLCTKTTRGLSKWTVPEMHDVVILYF